MQGRHIVRIICCLIIYFLTLSSASASDFALTSPSFKDQDRIPTRYTCDDKNISPPLNWSNPPPNTVAFALTLESPDWSAGFVHLWVLYNIPKNIHSLAEAASIDLPQDVQVGINYYNESGYNGPCPPDTIVHHYVFTIYALDTILDIPYTADTDTILDHIIRHTIQRATLTGLFSH